MSSQTATQPIAERREALVTTWRQRLISMLGPMTSLAGVVWAIVQPYRVTALHPHGESFWWLAVEPPLLVVVAGALFHLLVVRRLLQDLEEG